jgi:hypothetical protein
MSKAIVRRLNIALRLGFAPLGSCGLLAGSGLAAHTGPRLVPEQGEGVLA